MPASFPATVKTFTTKVNNVDTIDASHVNDIQDEVNAIETLLNGTVAVPAARVTTWTPTFVTTGVNFASITYSAQVGYQMRIGGVVFLMATVALSAIDKTGATGNVRIGGLPVSIVNIAGATTGGAISISHAQNWTTAGPSAARISGTQLQLFSNLNFTEVPVANIGATSNCIFTAFYFYTTT